MSGLTDTQVDAVASAATRLVAALRDMVDTEAHGEPSPSPTGTSSAGDGGQRSPDAPSTQEEHPPQAGRCVFCAINEAMNLQMVWGSPSVFLAVATAAALQDFDLRDAAQVEAIVSGACQ